MNGRRRAKTAAVVSLALLLAIAAITVCAINDAATDVEIVNKTGSTMTSVWVEIRGRDRYVCGNVAEGRIATAKLFPRGETEVKIGFQINGVEVTRIVDAYLDKGDTGRIRIIVLQSGEIVAQSKLKTGWLFLFR